MGSCYCQKTESWEGIERKQVPRKSLDQDALLAEKESEASEELLALDYGGLDECCALPDHLSQSVGASAITTIAMRNSSGAL